MDHDYQDTDYSCGAAALQMALQRAGADAPGEPALMDELDLDMQGSHVDAIVDAVARRGLAHVCWHGDVSLADLQGFMDDHAVMVCYQSRRLGVGHFAVLDDITHDQVVLADPWFGPDTQLDLDEFMECWRSEPKGSTPRNRWFLAIQRNTD